MTSRKERSRRNIQIEALEERTALSGGVVPPYYYYTPPPTSSPPPPPIVVHGGHNGGEAQAQAPGQHS